MATSAQLRREILAGQWDEALCTLYGTEPAVLARQRQRYAAALEQFELYYGPGRQVQDVYKRQPLTNRSIQMLFCFCEGWLGLLCCSLRRPRCSKTSI